MTTLADYRGVCGDLAAALAGDAALPIAGLACDSRVVQPGQLFVAVNGAKRDGREFVPDAVRRGAAAVAMVGEPLAPVSVPVLQVTDDYAALGRMAELAYGYPARQLRLAAITGTSGKTTTAFLLAAMLRAAGRRTGMIGTVRYEVGEQVVEAGRTTPTPLELQALYAQMVAAGVTEVVIEASSHALAQRRMGTLPVAVAGFSNLSRDHGDFHPTMEDYFQAKRRLFTEYLGRTGQAVINLDDSYGRRLAADVAPARLTGCSRNGADAALRALTWEPLADGARLTLEAAGERVACTSPLSGGYNVDNVLMAVGMALHLGVPLRTAVGTLERFAGVPGRLERVVGADGVTVFIDYAHKPDALAKMLPTVKACTKGRLIVVFGCGGERDKDKRPEMARESARYGDVVFVTSDNPRNEDPEAILDQIEAGMPKGAQYHRMADRRAAIRAAIAGAAAADTVVIAGKGHETYQEIKGVNHPFSDRQVAEEALAQRAGGTQA